MGYLVAEISGLLVAAALIGFICGWGIRHMLGASQSSQERLDGLQARLAGAEAERDSLAEQLQRQPVAQAAEPKMAVVSERSSGAQVDRPAPTFGQQSFATEQASAPASGPMIGLQIAENLRSSGAAAQQRGEMPIGALLGVDDELAHRLREFGVRTSLELLGKTEQDGKLQRLAADADIDEAQLLRARQMADLVRVPKLDTKHAALLVDSGVHSVAELANWTADGLHAALESANAHSLLLPRVASIELVDDWLLRALDMPAADGE